MFKPSVLISSVLSLFRASVCAEERLDGGIAEDGGCSRGTEHVDAASAEEGCQAAGGGRRLQEAGEGHRKARETQHKGSGNIRCVPGRPSVVVVVVVVAIVFLVHPLCFFSLFFIAVSVLPDTS